MRIIIDNSILYAGGGIQVAISFLNDLKELNLSNEYYVIQSPNIHEQMKSFCFPNNFHFYHLNGKSYRNVYSRARETKRIEDEIQPDCIFTVFGPSYHKSNFPKVVGFAIPFIVYPDSPFFKIISFGKRLYYNVLGKIKSFLFIRNSDSLIFETDDAKRIFKNKNNLKNELYTVSNTINGIFLDKGLWKDIEIEKCGLNILCLSANYPHKNLTIIPDVIEELLKIDSKLDFKFNISAQKEDFNFDSKYYRYINFLGKIDLDRIPNLYKSMDILFMPTLLEVFSTSYLEAMFMKVPIVASDMSFARDICGNSALYCSPTDPKSYADNLYMLIKEDGIKSHLIDLGTENLKRFGSSKDRTLAFLEIINKTIMKHGKDKR